MYIVDDMKTKVDKFYCYRCSTKITLWPLDSLLVSISLPRILTLEDDNGNYYSMGRILMEFFFLVATSFLVFQRGYMFYCLSFRFLQNQTIVWSSTMLLKGLWIKILYWESLWMERICFVMQDLNWYQALLRYAMLYCKTIKWLLSICSNAIQRLICFQMDRGNGWSSVRWSIILRFQKQLANQDKRCRKN